MEAIADEALPPQVEDESVRTKVFDYEIPIEVDGGPATIGVESTILGWEEHDDAGKWMCYRVGGIPLEAIEKVLGKVGHRSDPA